MTRGQDTWYCGPLADAMSSNNDSDVVHADPRHTHPPIRPAGRQARRA